jgi:hypothetical protein
MIERDARTGKIIAHTEVNKVPIYCKIVSFPGLMIGRYRMICPRLKTQDRSLIRLTDWLTD